jgi:hypothetical protein
LRVVPVPAVLETRTSRYSGGNSSRDFLSAAALSASSKAVSGFGVSAGGTQHFHLHDGDTVVFFGDSITNQPAVLGIHRDICADATSPDACQLRPFGTERRPGDRWNRRSHRFAPGPRRVCVWRNGNYCHAGDERCKPSEQSRRSVANSSASVTPQSARSMCLGTNLPSSMRNEMLDSKCAKRYPYESYVDPRNPAPSRTRAA